MPVFVLSVYKTDSCQINHFWKCILKVRSYVLFCTPLSRYYLLYHFSGMQKVLGTSNDLGSFPKLKAELSMRQPLCILGDWATNWVEVTLKHAVLRCMNNIVDEDLIIEFFCGPTRDISWCSNHAIATCFVSGSGSKLWGSFGEQNFRVQCIMSKKAKLWLSILYMFFAKGVFFFFWIWISFF